MTPTSFIMPNDIHFSVDKADISVDNSSLSVKTLEKQNLKIIRLLGEPAYQFLLDFLRLSPHLGLMLSQKHAPERHNTDVNLSEAYDSIHTEIVSFISTEKLLEIKRFERGYNDIDKPKKVNENKTCMPILQSFL